MTEIKISEEQFDNFIKVVETALYDVIVRDSFEFSHMMCGFTSFASRQEIAIEGCIVDELKKLVDEDNKDKAVELGYKIWMALDAAVAGLYPLHKKYEYTAEEVYEFCKGTFHWLLGINHSPSMFDSLFKIIYQYDDNESENEDPSSDN